VTSNKQLDIGGDLNHGAHAGIYKGIFYHCGIKAVLQILLITPKVVNKIVVKFFRMGAISCWQQTV